MDFHAHVQAFMGHVPRIADTVWLHASAQVIGRVSIERSSSVWCGAVLRGDVNTIQIGERSNIQDNSVLHVSHPTLSDPDGARLIVGNDVTVGHGCILHGCHIGHACVIGMGSIIMDKTFVEPEVLLGAGSLVQEGQTLKGGYLYFGRPAKQIRLLTADEIAWLYYSAQHYARLAEQYRSQELP